MNEKAIVLIDPVSSGRLLKSYVQKYGYKLISIFTLTEDELKKSGKFIPYEEKILYCDHAIESKYAPFILDVFSKLKYDIVAIIPASEPGVELADQLADFLKLKGNPVSTSLARRDKYETRLAIKRAGLPGPDFRACYTKDDLSDFIANHTFPVVLKTPKGAGAHHVFICHNETDSHFAFNQIMEGKNIFGQMTSFALVEEFIPSQQYVIEIFGDGNTLHFISAWKLDFIKNSQNKSIFHKMSVVTDDIQLKLLKPAIDYAISVGKAVDIKIGPCLAEIRFEPGSSPMLIEVGARLSGIDLPLLVKEASSFDPFAATIQAYTSNFKLDFVKFHKEAALVFCPVDGNGTVVQINGITEIQKLPSYVTHKLDIDIGDNVRASYDLATIPLYIYLSHENKNQLEVDIVEAKKLFNVKFDGDL